MKSLITHLSLLQRIRRWAKKHPNHAFRRYRHGTDNYRRYGQAAVWADSVLVASGTLEEAARAVGIST